LGFVVDDVLLTGFFIFRLGFLFFVFNFRVPIYFFFRSLSFCFFCLIGAASH